MDLRNIPLNALKAFEAVGRHCHVRKAAIEMHISHPALSRHVKQLEHRLGVDLFTRSGNKLALTSAGKRLLSSVQSAFAELSKGILYLDPDKIAGEIVIASTATIYMNWLLRILRDFQSHYPEVQLVLKTIEPRQQALPSEFDFAICLGEPDERVRSIRKLYEERYMPVCSPQLMKNISVCKPSELLDYPLLHDNWDHWGKWFASQGVEYTNNPRNNYFDYAYQATEAARLGMGIALADKMELQVDIQTGKLIQVFEHSFTIGQSVYLVADGVDKQSARTKLAIALIAESFGQNDVAVDPQISALLAVIDDVKIMIAE